MTYHGSNILERGKSWIAKVVLHGKFSRKSDDYSELYSEGPSLLFNLIPVNLDVAVPLKGVNNETHILYKYVRKLEDKSDDLIYWMPDHPNGKVIENNVLFDSEGKLFIVGKFNWTKTLGLNDARIEEFSFVAMFDDKLPNKLLIEALSKLGSV